ncbi:MAG TPA: UbiH/UbiF/VisC/COQ6 family ubiquinone biosynthesis hydroxylase [Gammaproteobacteria bacterium]|nr:UbiH/UbiF/VisC/COQ6 family ubiquinone biosynthesis hydroxylase [Gammaproteobacteria bacterium]
MKHDFDLVIVGAGAVGSALACALRDSGLDIALLDARRPEKFVPEAELDLRVFALSQASIRILGALGAWQTIRAARVAPYREMQVWDAGGAGRLHFDCADVGEPWLGCIVENRLIQSALWQSLESAHAVTLLAPASLKQLQTDADGVRFTLDSGRHGRARLLVAADGAASATRQLLGIGTHGWSYDQRAIVAHLNVEKPHRDTAWQRFLPGGPLALLPLADGRVSLVWSADTARAQALEALDDAAFNAAVGTASEHVLGRVTGTTRRAGFPLQLMHAARYSGPRCVLIGDAAHVVHPLAGQGVNLGLLDAAVLAETLMQAMTQQRDLGDPGVLRRYERARKADTLLMMYALDGLKRLFSNDNAMLARLRNDGMRAVDRFTPLKSVFVRRAMGLSGELPALARANVA